MNNSDDKKEFEAEIRNRLTFPLTVLNQFVDGKELPKSEVRLAIEELEKILHIIEGD